MAFVHERHGRDSSLPRFAGWWGNDPATRFSMGADFEPQEGAAGWQTSNAPILSMAALRASLEDFARVGMPALREKSEALSAYTVRLLDELAASLRARGKGDAIALLTPRAPALRGCPRSLRITGDMDQGRARLAARDVVCDVRRPDVIRAAPVPLYNSFEDAWRFVDALGGAL